MPKAAAFALGGEEDLGVCEVEASGSLLSMCRVLRQEGAIQLCYNCDGQGFSPSFRPKKVICAFADADNSLVLTKLHLKKNEFSASENGLKNESFYHLAGVLNQMHVSRSC